MHHGTHTERSAERLARLSASAASSAMCGWQACAAAGDVTSGARAVLSLEPLPSQRRQSQQQPRRLTVSSGCARTCIVRVVASVISVLASGALTSGEEQRSDADRERLILPTYLQTAVGVCNWLAIGAERDAVTTAIKYGGRRAERLERTNIPHTTDQAGYDCFERWRIWDIPSPKEPFSEHLCLFYADGFLLAKCIVDAEQQRTHAAVYQHEIASGRQHPPANSEIMEAVRWGDAEDANELLPNRGPPKRAMRDCDRYEYRIF